MIVRTVRERTSKFVTRSISKPTSKLCLVMLMLLPGALAFAQEPFAITHGPYLLHLDTTDATIVWATNRNSVAWVELAPDDGSHFYAEARPRFYDSHNGLKSISTIHSVRLNDLKPNTKYRYRILAQEVVDNHTTAISYGPATATDVFRKNPFVFRTPDPSATKASFAMLTDIHGHNDVMESLLKQVPWPTTDLVLFCGDMASSMQSEEQVFEDFMDTAVNLFATETPIYYARGNHETRGPWASHFADYFPSPEGQLYYMFQRGPVCFVVLDCGEDKPDSDIEYAGMADFDAYRTQEAVWLKKALQSDMYRNAAYKIAVVHIPPFDSWHGSREINAKFASLFNDAGVDIMLCGHIHRYYRMQPQEGVYKFPVVTNSTDTILLGETNSDGLHIKVLGVDGKAVDEFVIPGHSAK